MNKVMLLGRLTAVPEIRYSQNAEQTAIARFALAVNRRFKKEDSDNVDFINCVAFDKTAEIIEAYVKKGDMISIVGRLQVRSWEDDDKQKKWTTEIIIEELHFTGSKKEETVKEETVKEETKKNRYSKGGK